MVMPRDKILHNPRQLRVALPQADHRALRDCLQDYPAGTTVSHLGREIIEDWLRRRNGKAKR